MACIGGGRRVLWPWTLLALGLLCLAGATTNDTLPAPVVTELELSNATIETAAPVVAARPDVVAKKKKGAPPGSVGLEWRELECWTNEQRHRPGRQILRKVAGRARAGRLLAIMGPSGSGKTTLLNTLAGQLPYQRNLKLRGEINILHSDALKGGGGAAEKGVVQKKDAKSSSSSGGGGGFVFVKQEDLFYSHLTVRETLLFTARLRLPKTMDVGEKREYVEQMIFRMGLAGVADTLVGDEKKRGISGGERKRLSIACELMGNPSKIIFADEPTSGLDSFQAQIVMAGLKKLCDEGHTVIVSIHQPRSTVYQMFDDIILLSDGRSIYHGEAEHALPYFEAMGYTCPLHFNPAEFMLDLVSIDNASPSMHAESTNRVQRLADTFLKSEEARALVPSPNAKRVPMGDYLAERSRRRKARAGWLEQFSLLIGRQWKQTSRDMFTNGIRAASTVALAGIFGSIFWKLGLTESAIQERSAVLMHTCINTGMIAMVKTLNLFTRERVIVGRERTKRLYDTSAYVLSKVFGELPIDAFFPIVFGCIVYPMAGLQCGQNRFLSFISALALQTLTASSIGLTIGSMSPSTEAALAMGPSLMVVFILLSGQVGTSNSKIPAAIRWVQDLSIIRWAFEALCVNEFEGLSFTLPNPSPWRLLPGVPNMVKITGRAVLDKLDMPMQSSVSRALGAQGTILTANYLLTYLGLRFKAPRFQPLLAPLPSPPKALPNPSLPSRPSKAQPLSTQVGVAPSSSATNAAPRSRLTVGGGSLSSTGKRPTVLAAPLRGGGLKGW